ncbi:pentatricopeptide repeat-containing protein At3g14730-like isoform X2 [Malania oleifera]|nr:pentatricopeptide repeat-containing protein At3g14730-like isoform X2 [Malania oleifera]
MLINGFLRSPLSVTSLINMYAKCSQMIYALLVFECLASDSNVYTWNAIIAGFITNDLAQDAFQYYRKMRHVGVSPDKFTFPSTIKASCDLLEIKKIHGELFKFGLEFDPFIGSALVNSYLKFGFMDDAHTLFEELPIRDVVLWNVMMHGYVQIGQFDMALMVFRQASEEGIVPSKFTVTGILSVFAVTGDLKNGRAVHGFIMKMGYDSGVAVSNALVDMYGKCKCVADAQKIFEIMLEKDIFSWNSIISVYEQSGDHDGTLRIFDQMLDAGIRPDLVTITAVLPACSHLAALRHGREIHGYMIVNGLGKDVESKSIDDVFVNNAVMDMYAKCGSLRDAHLVFDKMINKDVVSWNIMILSYAMHGDGGKALDMFSSMCKEQLKPDEVTFVGILSACSHAGFVCEGREFLRQMKSKYGVVPQIEHYTCVIDMLGRAGQLEEAYELVLTMPIEGNPVVWRAFLAACRLHKNAALAEVAAQRVFELDPEHCGTYVLMSNVYGEVGRYEEVLGMRHTMKQQNLRKTPGCSWIELESGLHVFVTADKTHPEALLIYAGLSSLTARLREHGYVPNV